jgi:hypothetical protein
VAAPWEVSVTAVPDVVVVPPDVAVLVEVVVDSDDWEDPDE